MGAGTIDDGSKIKFDPNTPGETATFTLSSVLGMQYVIRVTGQNNQSSSFFQFLIDADGPGPAGFVQLGSNVNFSALHDNVACGEYCGGWDRLHARSCRKCECYHCHNRQ